jgi:hypothetical protein
MSVLDCGAHQVLRGLEPRLRRLDRRLRLAQPVGEVRRHAAFDRRHGIPVDRIGAGAFAVAAVADGRPPQVQRLYPAFPCTRPAGMSDHGAGGGQQGSNDVVDGGTAARAACSAHCAHASLKFRTRARSRRSCDRELPHRDWRLSSEQYVPLSSRPRLVLDVASVSYWPTSADLRGAHSGSASRGTSDVPPMLSAQALVTQSGHAAPERVAGSS